MQSTGSRTRRQTRQSAAQNADAAVDATSLPSSVLVGQPVMTTTPRLAPETRSSTRMTRNSLSTEHMEKEASLFFRRGLQMLYECHKITQDDRDRVLQSGSDLEARFGKLFLFHTFRIGH